MNIAAMASARARHNLQSHEEGCDGGRHTRAASLPRHCRWLAHAARREWHPAGQALAGHDISALAEDAAGSLLAGTAAGELFRSDDAGASWSQVGAGLTGQKIWAIVPDPHRPAGAFYAGLGGGHLFHSDDGGASWHELTGLRALPDAQAWWGPFGEAIFHSVLPVADQPGKLYAGLSVVGVLATDDGGATWRDTTASVPSRSTLLARCCPKAGAKAATRQ